MPHCEVISLSLEASEVKPGENVAGCVLLRVREEFPFIGLEFALIGTEKTMVQKVVQGGESLEYSTLKQENVFLHDVTTQMLPIAEPLIHPRMQPGEYNFNFDLKLPKYLLPSFQYKTNAEIEYKIRVKVLEPAKEQSIIHKFLHRREIIGFCRFTVSEPTISRSSRMISELNLKPFNFQCSKGFTLTKGQLELSGTLPSRLLSANVLRFPIEIKNNTSKIITKIRITLTQVLKTAAQGTIKLKRKEVVQHEALLEEQITAGMLTTRFVEFSIPSHLPVNFQGVLVSRYYEIEIALVVAGFARNLKIEFPVWFVSQYNPNVNSNNIQPPQNHFSVT